VTSREVFTDAPTRLEVGRRVRYRLTLSVVLRSGRVTITRWGEYNHNKGCHQRSEEIKEQFLIPIRGFDNRLIDFLFDTS